MKVSVVIPTYKRPGMLGRAIESVLGQTHKDVEIIVVDDNDPKSEYRSETEIYMKQYENVSNLKYIKRKSNGGGCASRNTGINEATSDYICFLDDDDEFLPTNIEKQLKNLIIKDADVSVCGSTTINQYNQIESTKNYNNFNKEEDKMIFHVTEMIVGTQTFFMKKSIIESIGGFMDVPAGQEYVLMYRLIEAGAKVAVVNETLTNIYIHSGERITVGNNKIKGEKILYKMKKKYFYKLNYKQKRIVRYRYYSVVFGTYWKMNKKIKAFYYLTICLLLNPIRTVKVMKMRTKNKIKKVKKGD